MRFPERSRVSKSACHSGSFVPPFPGSLRALAIFTVQLLSAFAVANSNEPLAQRSVRFDFPAQQLGDSLRALGFQTNTNVLFDPTLVEGRSNHALKQTTTVREALAQLLKGSGLGFQYIDDKTVTLIPQQQSRDVSASTTLATGEAAEEPPQHAARIASAERPDQEADTQQSETVEEVTVTGSHIRGAQSASPILIFTQLDFDRAGSATAEQFLATIPQNFGGGPNTDTRTTINNPTFGSAVNLRGLGSASTLVLLDGRRTAVAGQAAFVDVSMIPLSAIERIEVLTDGASALYGSDAIGGVVNFIMRKNYEGAETRLRAGGTASGGGAEYQVGQSLGAQWENGGALVSYEYYQRGAITSFERDYSKDSYASFARGLVDLIPHQDRQSVYLSMRQAASEKLDIISSLLYSDRDSHYVGWNPFAIEREDTNAGNKQYSGNIGLSAKLSNSWRGDFTGGFSKIDSESSFSSPGLLSSSGPSRSSYKYKLASLDATFTGDLIDLSPGTVKLAVGGSYRTEKFDFSIDGSPSSGDNFNSRAIFGEVQLPLVAGRSAATPALTASLSGRYERYSSYGSTFDPKFGIAWKPVEPIRVRATYGTSFKAPSLFELNEYNGFNFLFDLPDSQSSSSSGTTRTVLRYGNNSSLHEESARTWTAGLDLFSEHFPSFRMNVTYFNVRYRDRIDSPATPFTSLDDPLYQGILLRRDVASDVGFDSLVNELLSGQVQVGGCAVDLNANGGCPEASANIGAVVEGRLLNFSKAQVSGLDLSVSQRVNSGWGIFDLALNGSYLFGFERQTSQDTPLINLINTVGFPVDLKLRATTTWNRNRWAVSGSVNYTDPYTTSVTAIGTPVSSWTTADLTIGYSAGDHFGGWLDGSDLSLSAINLFDRDPPLYEDGFFNIGYDPANGDPFGRIISLMLTKQW